MERTTRQPWLGIELRHLAALCAVAREGSFRGAADSLGYVQSAVSQQLAYLERLVGAPLVVRRRGQAPVALTEQGELLVAHFSEILGRIGAAHADVEALREGRAGRLRVGLFESAAARLMPPILAALSRDDSNLRVELEELRDQAWIAEHVEAGALDVGFGVAPLPAGPFEARHVVADPYVLLAPAAWSLPPEPAPEDLAELRLVGPDCHRSSELRELGVELGGFPHATSDAAAQGLVAAGIGAAILPLMSVAPESPRTQVIDLGHLLPPRQVVIFWHRDRSAPAALDHFLSLAVDSCRKAGADHPPMALAA